MGRSDYLVQAGVGFDVDRSGARKSLGVFESLASMFQTAATKKAAEGFAETEKAYEDSLASIGKSNKKAEDEFNKGVAKSARATQEALHKTRPKTPEQMKEAGMKGKELKKYKDDFAATTKGMTSSYSKFTKEAEKMGIKVSKSKKGWGHDKTVLKFAKADIESRKKMINLTGRMVKDTKRQIEARKKEGKSTAKLQKELKALEQQERDMKNLNEEVIQQEKKKDKIQSRNAKKQRIAEKKRQKDQKRHSQDLKARTAQYQRLGQVASMSAGKIKAGLQNAFVIGTAAATAFFYKMQPLVASVMEFEKTIVNANSVFNVTQKELHSVSDTMVKFTMKYGVSAQETATGLYQLASAGLSAAESQEVLQHTMKLAMATQGDHNTLAKLTTQTIMGFGMEMSDAGDLTDKFAHTIQKSLVEWQDLASSVKFAMPFFVATGQNIDQLLGGLEVLSNRALEAGIAGRGLRQALAQFAKHADDNQSAFAKMGISIMDAEGNMKALSDIAQEAKAAFGDVTDLEALTAMLEDMNVRGATAFALLVQNADEYESAVNDLANSAGEATQMADIQQQSLEMQIQRVKNALLAPFLLSDKVGEAGGSLNEFTLRIKELVDEFTQFFIVIGPDGEETYSKHGQALKEFVIAVLNEAVGLIRQFKEVFLETTKGDGGFETLISLLHMATFPMKVMLKFLKIAGPGFMKWFAGWKLLTSLLPITNVLSMIQTMIQTKLFLAMSNNNKERMEEITLLGVLMPLWAQEAMFITSASIAKNGYYATMKEGIGLMWAQTKALFGSAAGWVANNMAMSAGILFFVALIAAIFTVFEPLNALAVTLFAAAAAWIAFHAASSLGVTAAIAIAAVAAGLAAIAVYASGWGVKTGPQNNPVTYDPMKFNKERNYDGGGTYLPVMDNGGLSTEHGAAILQKGETVTPKTQNMLGGGVTLNFGDVHAQDGDDFAEKVASALPDALRRANDEGAV